MAQDDEDPTSNSVDFESEPASADEIMDFLTNSQAENPENKAKDDNDEGPEGDVAKPKPVRLTLDDLRDAGFESDDFAASPSTPSDELANGGGSYAVMGKSNEIKSLIEKSVAKVEKGAKGNKAAQVKPVEKQPKKTATERLSEELRKREDKDRQIRQDEDKTVADLSPKPSAPVAAVEQDPTLFAFGGSDGELDASDRDLSKSYEDKEENEKSLNKALHDAFNLNSQDAENELSLYDLHKVAINDREKENYLHALLNNDVFRDVLDFKGVRICIASKTMSIQTYIADKIAAFANESTFDASENVYKVKHTPMELLKYALYLNAVMSVESVNSKNVFKNDKRFTMTTDEWDKLVEDGTAEIEKMPAPTWNLLLNAVRIFDRKEFLLGKEMLSGDF